VQDLFQRKIFYWGGVAATLILLAFGVGTLVVGLSGRDQVRSDIGREAVVGTPDMSPKAIQAEAAQAHLTGVDLPTCSVAGQKVDTGSRARCFASYMRVHALEATGGKTYAQMPAYIGKDGKPTESKASAALDPKTHQAVQNPARNVWVNEFALSTALNTSYFAEQVSMFSIAVGIMLLIIGGGFGVLTFRLVRQPRGAKAQQPEVAAAPASAS
jgi:hypothetical protein